jgi:hypothetical protein
MKVLIQVMSWFFLLETVGNSFTVVGPFDSAQQCQNVQVWVRQGPPVVTRMTACWESK